MVVLSATRTVATAVEAMKLGAADYVTKPFEIDALRIKVRQLLERRALEQRSRAAARRRSQGASRLGRLIGRSDAMRSVFRTIERVADGARDRADHAARAAPARSSSRARSTSSARAATSPSSS